MAGHITGLLHAGLSRISLLMSGTDKQGTVIAY